MQTKKINIFKKNLKTVNLPVSPPGTAFILKQGSFFIEK